MLIEREVRDARRARSIRATPRRLAPVLLSAAVVAAALAFDTWGFAPFGAAKVTLVAVLVLAGAAGLAGRAVAFHRGTAVAWAVLLGWLLVATVTAVDHVHAWIGTPDRRFGWLTWALCAIAFACGQSLTGAVDARILTRCASVATLGAGAYALVELLGVAPVDIDFASGRTGGPFGQPAYLGAAAALLLPIALCVACDRTERTYWRVIAASGAGLGLFALLASQARAAWVGITVAALVAAPRVLPRDRRRPVVIATALAAVVLVSVGTPLGARAISTFDPSGGTARGRIDEWEVATRALTERPVLGAGPEGYRIVFAEAVDRDYEQRYGREVVPDRAHNGALDVGVTAGLPAAIAYLALHGFVVVAAVRAVRRAPPWLAGIGAGVLAYAVQQQFLFPLAELDPIFWILAGVLLACTTAPYVQRRVRLPRAALVPIAVAALAVFAAGAREIASDHALRDATRATARLDHPAALHAADRATQLRPDSIRNWFVAARTAEAGGTIVDIDAAIARIDRGLEQSPRDPILRTEQARLLLERARRSQHTADLDRARRALERLVAEDPNHAGHHLQLGVALVLAAQRDAAEEQFRIAADLAPDSSAPRRNLEALLETP